MVLFFAIDSHTMGPPHQKYRARIERFLRRATDSGLFEGLLAVDMSRLLG